MYLNKNIDLSPACLPIPPSRHPVEKKPSNEGFLRAKDGIRTRDPDLGKVVLYQLSYFRLSALALCIKEFPVKVLLFISKATQI
jgi:hypothetical protein